MQEANTPTILIIVARYIPNKEKSYYEFPLGLAYISACLKKAGYGVDVLNINHYADSQIDLISRKFSANKYRYVLTSGLSAHYKQIKGIVDDVRRVASDAVMIVGGGVVTAMPEVMYDYIRPDYMVLGEGELTIVELINALNTNKMNLSEINGIGHCDAAGKLIITSRREPIMDLDSIPWPDLDGFEFETYLEMQRPNDSLYLYIDDKPRFYPIISSRGCPYNCTFCYHPLGQKYRSRSVDDFIAEVTYVTEKYNVNNLAIFDELISADPKRLFEICDRIKKLPRKINWMCQLRVDKVDDEMLRVMKDAGCFIISYGFESASNSVLKSMKKFITAEQIEKAMQLTRKAGIGVQAYFIFGDPAETKKSSHETLRFWKDHSDYHITMGYIRPYPGSELWKQEMDKGNIKDATEQLGFLDQCVNNPPNLSKMTAQEWFELQKNVQKAIMMNSHFGEFISSKRVEGEFHSLTVRCPHCEQVTTYNNFHQRILGVFKLACRHCNQTMNMTPLAFENVRNDYARNMAVYEKIKAAETSVVITPCMNEAEFAAMQECFLENVNITGFLDRSDVKVGKLYMGKTVLKRDQATINSLGEEQYYLIPLTRYANRIFDHLVSMGVNNNHICRLDEILIGEEKGSLCTNLLEARKYTQSGKEQPGQGLMKH